MEFWTTIVGLLRRRRVIIPAVLVALALGAAVYLGTPSTYTSSTTMVLTTTEYGGTESQDPTDPTELTNPMLNFNESLRTTSAILISAMGTRDVATQLGAVGPTRLIVNDGRTNPDLLGLNGPFVYIVAESTSSDDAERVVVEAQKLMRQKLRDWQRSLGAPDKTFVSLVGVVPPSSPQVDHGRARKLGMLAFIFGFLLFMGVAYFGHQVRARRRARAAAVSTTPTPPEAREPARDRRPPRSPDLVADDAEEDAGPAVVSAPKTKAEPIVVSTEMKRAAPAQVPTPRTKKTQPARVPTSPTSPKKEGGPVLAAVPMKLNARSRNR